MNLLSFELKKIFSSPVQRWICVILLLSSFFLTATASLQEKNESIPRAELDLLIEAYEQNPDAVMKYYAEREEVWQLYRDTIAHMTKEEAEQYPQPLLPDVYAISEKWTDDDLYTELFSIIEYRDNFQKDISALLLDAYGKYEAYLSAGTTNRAAIELQYQYLRHYSTIQQNVDLPLSRVVGWDTVMYGVFPDILCGLIILLLICPLFTLEKSVHFQSVQRVCRKGRKLTTLSKLLAAALCALGVTLFISVGTLATVAIADSLSDPSVPIQCIPAMKYCPWDMTVLQYWFFTLGLKLFAFSMLALIACGISAVSARAGQSLLLGMILWVGCGAGIFMPENSFWAQCNLLSLAGGASVGTRYRGYELLDLVCIGQLPMSFLLWGLVAILGVCLTFSHVRCFRPRSPRSIPSSKVPCSSSDDHRTAKHLSATRKQRCSIFSGEFRKICSSLFCVAVVIAFLLIEVASCIYHTLDKVSASDEEYRRYTTQYAGELTDENITFLITEKQEIDSILAQYEVMLTKAREGQITSQQWQEYVLRYAEAYKKHDAIDRVVERIGALSSVTSDKIPYLLYDTGWQRIFNQGADLVLILIVVFVSAVVFPLEYRKTSSGGSFAPLLRSTRRGRLPVLLSKCGMTAIISTTLTLISQITALLPLFMRDEWISPEAPLSSLALFVQSPDMTIGEYAIFCVIIRVVGMALLSIAICLISCIYRKELFSLLSVSVLLFLPHVLAPLGMEFSQYMDFLNFFACTPLLQIKNAAISVFIYYPISLILIAGALFFVCYRWSYRSNDVKSASFNMRKKGL